MQQTRRHAKVGGLALGAVALLVAGFFMGVNSPVGASPGGITPGYAQVDPRAAPSRLATVVLVRVV